MIKLRPSDLRRSRKLGPRLQRLNIKRDKKWRRRRENWKRREERWKNKN